MIFAAATFAQQQTSAQQTAAPQAANGQAFTLEQCIDYALQNSPTMKNAAIDQRVAAARVKETRGIGLPQVDASVGITHNQKLPRMFFQNDPERASFIDLSGIPGIQPYDVVAMQNLFQLKSAGNASLNISQILFNGSYVVGLQAANAYKDLSLKAADQTREVTIEQVTKAYYAVLINKDRIDLFDVNLSRVDSLLRTTKALNENGFAEGIDVDRIQVTVNNLKAQRDNFKNMQEVGLLLLKFQMNYPMDQPIEVIGDIASLEVDENVLSRYALEWDYKQRPDYRMLESNRRLQSLNLKNKYAEGMPSLVAFANLGYSTQSPNIGGLFKTESSIAEDDMAGYGPDKWYSFSTFGVTLNVPLFSGLQRNYRVQQEKLNLQKIENDFATLRSSIDLETKRAALSFLNAVNILKSQQENRVLAENVARVTKIKYEQGVGSNIEVIDAESALREAQINYYTALYEATVAKVDLDKAYGKLLSEHPTENK
jgi:outer membrane protein TolC